MPRITCPTCGAMLEVTDDLLGSEVECGSCHARFTAEASDRPSPELDESDDRDDYPRRRRSRYDDEDDSPRRRRRSGGNTGLATASLVLGILSLVFVLCCTYLSVPLSVVGLILGVMGMKTAERSTAIGGVVTSALGLVFSVLLFAGWFALNIWMQNNMPPPPPPAPPPPPRVAPVQPAPPPRQPADVQPKQPNEEPDEP